MIGLRCIHTKRNGLMPRKMIALILACSVLLSGCSTAILDWLIGDDWGSDWTIDLISGYSIVKVNSHCIVLGHKESPEHPGYSNVISCYFVTAYKIQGTHIAIEGIPTQGDSISDQELASEILNYYLVDTVSGDIAGPYKTKEAFAEFCTSLNLDVNEEWIKAKESPNRVYG